MVLNNITLISCLPHIQDFFILKSFQQTELTFVWKQQKLLDGMWQSIWFGKRRKISKII
jgi:hypothetical protein